LISLLKRGQFELNHLDDNLVLMASNFCEPISTDL